MHPPRFLLAGRWDQCPPECRQARSGPWDPVPPSAPWDQRRLEGQSVQSDLPLSVRRDREGRSDRWAPLDRWGRGSRRGP